MAVDTTLEDQLGSTLEHLDALIETARQLPAWQRDLLENPLNDLSSSFETMVSLVRELHERANKAELEQRVQERTSELQVIVQRMECEIEERQRAEQALAENQRFLQLILDCLPTPMFYKDTEGRFLGCNQAFEKFTGYPLEAIIGKTIDELTSDDLAAVINSADQALYHDLEAQVYESTAVGADGLRYNVIYTQAPFFNQDDSLGGLVGTIFDITERKRLEAYMMRTERLAAMGNVAAALAHEIKNPLQTVQSNVELVLDFKLDPAEQDEYLRLCYREIQRLIDITSRLLNLALPRREPGQPAQITEQIDHVLSLLARKLETAKIEVETTIAPELATETLPEQVVEVLFNLINNAVEAIPIGGTISISAWNEANRASIAVKNSGPPIANEILERIFEPFFTTKPDGSGLGLPISYNILEQLGGNLFAENLEDGVQFTISLPLDASSSAATRGEPSSDQTHFDR